MPRKSALILTSALVSASLIGNTLAADAGTLSHNDTAIHQTLAGNAALRAALSCGGTMGHPGQVATPSGHGGHMGGGHMGGGPQIFAPVSVNQNVNQDVNVSGSSNVNSAVNGQNFNVQNSGGNTTIVNKPITVQTNIDNSKNIDINKPVTVNNNINNVKNIEINKSIEVYKPVIINKSIDNSKTITINKTVNDNKNISINKNIDNSKNININKNVNININANSNITSNSNNNTTTVTDNSVSNSYTTSNSYSASTGYASAYADAGSNAVSSSLSGGDIAAAVDYVAKGGQCSFVDATVVKAIHAVCVSADGREFPASHMVGTSWIASGYEGEIARCLPGSTLKVSIGSVVQSDQGLAASMNGAETLTCGPRQAVRHYKDGMLKCAPAVKVVDCTERTNLRKWGTGDMFFSYVTKVCLDQSGTGGQTRETPDHAAARARQAYSRAPSSYGYGSADAAIDQRSR